MTLYLMDWHYLTLSQWGNRPKYRRCRSHSHLVSHINAGRHFLQSTAEHWLLTTAMSLS